MSTDSILTAYLSVEGELHAAIGNLDALARLIADRDNDEMAVGTAGLMFDQLERLKRVQEALDQAHAKGGAA